ncbi:MAG: energy transducer TonB [Panacagrimonas sp.]
MRALGLLFLLTSAAQIHPGVASDEFGIDFTTKPKVLPATCGMPALPAGPPPVQSPGVVEVTARVDDTGALIELRLTQSSGWPALDQAVLAAYRSCQFQPAIQNRVPVAGERELHYEWAASATEFKL